MTFTANQLRSRIASCPRLCSQEWWCGVPEPSDSGRFYLSGMGLCRMDALRTYAAFPVRVLLVALGVSISLLLIVTGTSWREEWDRMNFSGYLFGGKNWNIAGF